MARARGRAATVLRRHAPADMSPKNYYAPFIDGLRAIAVLAVIIYHLDPGWLPGGFSGVDVFFVISGFVVSASTQGWQGISLRDFLLRFYSRRFLRIIPALTVCLVVTAALSALFIPNAYLSQASQQTGMFAFIGASNFILAQTSNDYFSPITEFNPYTHTWSLGVEEQFYLVFPVLFVFWLRARKRLSMALYAIGFVLSIACAWWLVKANPTAAFYMPWSRFWQLASGVLLYQFMALAGHRFSGQSPEKKYFDLAGTISLAVLFAGLWFSRSSSAPFPGCVLSVIGALGVLAFTHGRSGGLTATILTLPALRFLGKISYSLYLWHWPIVVLFRWTIGIDSIVTRVVAAVLTLIAASLSYYFIETPMRRKALYSRKVVGIAIGAGLVCIGAFASTVIVDQQPQISRSVVAKHTDDWYPNWVASDPSVPGCALSAQSSTVNGGLVWKFSRVGCTKERAFAGNIYVIGDSHAMTYAAMLTQMMMTNGADVFAYNNGGCPFISLQLTGLAEHCVRYTQGAVADIVPKLKKGDIVFLASLRLVKFVDQWIDFGVENGEEMILGPKGVEGRKLGEQHAAPILKQFTDKGATVIFEAPTPLFHYVTFRCSDWFNRGNPICEHGANMSRELLENLRRPVVESLNRLAQSNDRVYVWDPFPILCPESPCSPYKDGRPLFFDGDHLSGYGNQIVTPNFKAFVQSVATQRAAGQELATSPSASRTR